MFSPVAMQRVSAVVLERDEHAVLRGLGRLGLVHLVRTKAGEDTAPLEPPDRSAEIGRCVELLTRLESLRRRLGLGAFPESEAEPALLTPAQIDENLKGYEARANELLGRQQSLRDERQQADTAVRQLEAYEGLDLPMDQFAGSAFLHFATGVMPAENVEELRQQVGPNVVLMALPERDGRSNVIAVSSRKAHYAMTEALEKAGFQHDTVKVPEGETPETLAAKTRGDAQEHARQLAEVGEAACALAGEIAPKLGELHQIARTERQILEAQQNFPRTGTTVLISGWAPKSDVAAIDREVASITHGRYIMTQTDPDDVPEQEIPTLLRNPWILRPFVARIVDYGLPGYREFEPTILFAITFVLMFGMMFGDAGQGGVLVLGALGLMKLGKSQAVRDAGLLMLLMGFSAIAFGITYGSYFGILWRPLWHDPVEGDPMGMVALGIGGGIVLMSIGLVLNMINKFRHRDWLGGFLDKFGMAGAIFYWGILGLCFTWAAVDRAGLAVVALVGVLVLPLLAIMIKEPLHVYLSRRRGHGEHGSMGEAIILAFIEAFDTVLLFMSNTISFIRLMAYSVAHAALLAVGFSIAGNMGDSVVGHIIGVVVIVIVNIIVILLEGIVSTIQAIRLEYYEFFGKFYTGGGMAFKPFRFSTKDE